MLAYSLGTSVGVVTHTASTGRVTRVMFRVQVTTQTLKSVGVRMPTSSSLLGCVSIFSSKFRQEVALVKCKRQKDSCLVCCYAFLDTGSSDILPKFADTHVLEFWLNKAYISTTYL